MGPTEACLRISARPARRAAGCKQAVVVMSEDAPETLFSFELLVDHIRLQDNPEAPGRLALGLRFLDFPTLLIYQRRSGSVSSHRAAPSQREFPFRRGKACFFKMSPGSLRLRLSATPLYVMVLDVTEQRSPGFLGSSLLSLAEAMGRIGLLSAPSAHTGKGVVAVSSLSGERIGTVSLSYKLVCLGESLLPHIQEGTGHEGTTSPEHAREKHKSGGTCFPTGSTSEFSLRGDDPEDPNILLDESEEDGGAESQTKKTFEEDLTVFCPPHLYYSNTARSQIGNAEQDYRLSNLDTEALTFEDSFCVGEEDKRKVSDFKTARRKMTNTTKTPGGQETSVVASDLLREALQRLPLLNALVAELSQLNVRPDPAQNTRPAPGDQRDPRQTKSLHENPQLADTQIHHLSPPRNCSTPVVDPMEVTNTSKESLSARKSQRKKLKYGTTKTYNLRLKQISPLKVNRRECRALMTSDAQSRSATEKDKSRAEAMKSKKRGIPPNQRPNLDEKIGTSMQSDSALRETVTLRPGTQQGARGSRAQGASGEFRPQVEPNLGPVLLPSVQGADAPLSEDEHRHDTAPDQSHPQSDGYQSREPLPEGQSGRSSSPESLCSRGSRPEDDANYADDFDSLESSSTSSSNPDRSPEALRANAPKSPVSPYSYVSDSRSEGFQRKSVPVPVQAIRSPHRALMGTRTIPPRSRSSALSSSPDSEIEERKVEQISSAESVLTSRRERKRSPRNRSLVRGFSAESTSSVEELEDELGSLDFRKDYKHISELVANKLPGYTM